MSTYVIGDVHGQYAALRMLLDKIQYNKDVDSLYFVGDYVDSGPASMETIKYIAKLKENGNVYCCLGNHDDMMLEFLKKKRKEIKHDIYGSSWFSNKGHLTYEQYKALPQEEQEIVFNFLRSLELFFDNVEVNNKKYYIAHAHPIKPHKNSKYEFSDKEILLWDRWHKLRYDPFGWMGKKYENHILICGHTITSKFAKIPLVDFRLAYPYTKEKIKELKALPKLKPVKSDRFINIDTGAKILNISLQGRLTALRLDDEKTFSVNPYKFTTNKKKLENHEPLYLQKKYKYPK